MKTKMKQNIKLIFELIGIVIISLLIKRYIVFIAEVPTGSMLETIQLNDKLIGNRMAYWNSEPQRGDVVIFDQTETDTILIKRLIGLPNDKVEIKEGTVYINGEKLVEEYVREPWGEDLDYMMFEVPEGCYFFMGDNRNESYDARYWENPYIPREDIMAKAEFIFLPFKDAKKL